VPKLLASTLVRHLAVAALALLALFGATVSISPYRNLQLATVALYACAAAGLTVLIGHSGQISLGHGAFMAVGAYASALLMIHRQLPLVVVLLTSVAITAALGALVGVAAARLQGPYLAGATLTIAIAAPAVANYESFTGVLGGKNGLSVPTRPAPLVLGPMFPQEAWLAWIACIATVVTFVLLANATRSRFGRELRAVRDDDVAAELAGIHLGRMRVSAFVVSAVCAGLAGALLAVVTSLAAPGAFGLGLSLTLLAVVVLGGLGSLTGAVFGAVVLVLLPSWSSDLAQHLGLSHDVYANFPLACYGLVLILLMLAGSDGVSGMLRRPLRWRRPEGRDARKAVVTAP
jgi:branched-chain amino acid transport system permease protein